LDDHVTWHVKAKVTEPTHRQTTDGRITSLHQFEFKTEQVAVCTGGLTHTGRTLYLPDIWYKQVAVRNDPQVADSPSTINSGIIAHKDFVIFVIFMRFLTNSGSCLTSFDHKKVKYLLEIRYFACSPASLHAHLLF